MYADQYTSLAADENQPDRLLPVESRWIGSWRLSVERRAHSEMELNVVIAAHVLEHLADPVAAHQRDVYTVCPSANKPVLKT